MNQTTTRTKQKYFIYARKSTDEYDKQVHSITDQITELRNFAQKEDLEVVEVLKENKTAKEIGREVFNEMLFRINNDEAQGILAWHPDRLARNSVDGGQIIHLIDKQKIISLKFPTFWFEPTPQGKFMLSVAFGQSKYYVDNLAQNIKRGMLNKARRGEYPKQAPIGYLNDRAKRVIVPDPMRAPQIQRMFEEYVKGTHTLETIRTVAPKTLKDKTPSKSQVRNMLSNTIYYGTFMFSGEIFEGSHKPIITKRLFDEAQKVLKDKSRPIQRMKSPHAYRGLLKCAHCGCSITSSTQKGHIYYHCSKKRGKCPGKYVRQKIIGEGVSKALQKVSLDSTLAQDVTERAKTLAKKEGEGLDALAHNLSDMVKQCNDKLDKLLDMSLNEEITAEEYHRKREKLIQEKTSIKEKVRNCEREQVDWLEPLLCFIKQAKSVEKIALSTNLTEKRNLFCEVGLNRKLHQFSVQYEPRGAWRVLQQQGERSERRFNKGTSVAKNNKNVQSGPPAWTRTRNHVCIRHALCQLSYRWCRWDAVTDR